MKFKISEPTSTLEKWNHPGGKPPVQIAESFGSNNNSNDVNLSLIKETIIDRLKNNK